MELSPIERREMLEILADKMLDRIEAQTGDLTDLVTLPVSAVGALTGLGPKQVARVMETRSIGARKLGVSLKVLRDYQTTKKTS